LALLLAHRREEEREGVAVPEGGIPPGKLQHETEEMADNHPQGLTEHTESASVSPERDLAETTKDTARLEEVQKSLDEGDRNAKAVKSDDAEIPVWLWNDRILDPGKVGTELSEATRAKVILALNRLRDKVLVKYFMLNVWRSFRQYLKERKSTKGETGKGRKRKAPTSRGKDTVRCSGQYVWSREEGHGRTRKYVWTHRGREDYKAWWKDHWESVADDRLPGLDAVSRAAESSWWEWDAGSAPFFWRWPEEYRETIRDGLKIWMKTRPAPYTRPQRREPDDELRAKVAEKLGKVRKRGYIASGEVKSLTDFFHVPKGVDDIRLVYNGSSSGLNECLWVPSFGLPTVNSTLRQVFPNSSMADTDLGEMFLCFVLNESLRELAGVDVTHYQEGEDESEGMIQRWERWARCAMGLKPSPYQTIQAMHFAEDVIRGDRRDKRNIFRWEEVLLNLPGSDEYDPSLPWVYKVRADGRPAADFWFYVDDNRSVGNDDDEAWQAASRVARVCNQLGIQDATRKRREASRNPGAWAGSMTGTDGKSVHVSCQQEKWDKARRLVDETVEEAKSSADGLLDRKKLESVRGFLLYVTRTYPSVVPYLKGFHNTLDGWRKDRDGEGWKIIKKIEAEEDDLGDEDAGAEPARQPSRVRPAPRLAGDLAAMKVLFGSAAPPKRIVRSTIRIEVYYGFGDASQDGFGFNFERSGDDGVVEYRYGQWCDAISEASSNYRELRNLVDRVEELVREGKIVGAEVFIFTDNTTAEAVFYKGNSTNRELFELMLRLRTIEMQGGLILHLLHVSGTRMIAEGADGASRGDLGMGAMVGGRVVDYVPLHLGCFERSQRAKQWLEDGWDTGRGRLRFLDPNDWFERNFEARGSYVWSPAPAAGEAAVEQMSRVIHQYPNSLHFFIVPRLMTSRWRRRVGRLRDLEMELGAGSGGAWGEEQHEPLLIFVCMPLSRHRPWKLRGTPLLERVEGQLRELLKTDHKGRRRLLRQFLVEARKMESLPEGMVRKLLLCAG
jgi:hypothetical protein